DTERTELVGGVIVEPKRGWRTGRATREYVLVQSELAVRGGSSPDLLVFNSYPDQYLDQPLAVSPKQRIRVFVLNAGLGPGAFAVAGVRDVRGWAGGKVRRGLVQIHTLPGSGAVLEFGTRPGAA